VGGNPEVHEKIHPDSGRGIVVLFSAVEGRYTYVTSAAPAREHMATDGVTVSFLADGRARIDAALPARYGGACIVFFGTH